MMKLAIVCMLISIIMSTWNVIQMKATIFTCLYFVLSAAALVGLVFENRKKRTDKSE